MSRYDIVVMGGGHNGLTAAAYMAKAGKKVLVLERKPHFGGGVSTRELIQPGYWHDEHSNVHIMIQGNPMLRQDELGLLSQFGLEYIYPELPHASIWEDGTVVRSWRDLDRTCQEIAAFGSKDAEAYRKFVGASTAALPMFMSGLYAPPFPMGAFVAMMDQSDEGRFLLDVMSRSALDVVEQYFDSERLKIHIVRMVTENLQMPDELGTGMGAFLMPGIIHSYGCSMPKGGSGELSKALVRAIEHWGGEVRCNAEVCRVVVSSGKAVGLELLDGKTCMAKDGVIGAIHPHVLRKFVSETPELPARRYPWLRAFHVSNGCAPTHPRSGIVPRAWGRWPISCRSVHAPGRRGVWCGACHGDPDDGRYGHRLRQGMWGRDLMADKKKALLMQVLDANDKELMTVRKIERDGDALIIRGKIFGAMPMVAKLTPAGARAALKLLDLRTILFLLTILFRK